MMDKYDHLRLVGKIGHSMGAAGLATYLYFDSTGDPNAPIAAICSIGIHTSTYLACSLGKIIAKLEEMKDVLQKYGPAENSLEKTIS